MIEITLDKEVTFELPADKFVAKITGIKPFNKQTGRGKQDWIRILFDVDVPGMRDFDCRAGRNFLLSFKQGSDLRNFLTPLLDSDFFKANSSKTINLEKLVTGMKGIVTLSHYCGDGYDKPLVSVESMDPLKQEGKD